jgi:iron complex transport system substrate-binding protein
MCAGNWVPELVEISGGRDVLGTAGKHSPYITWDDLRRAEPEVIAVMPCGFDISRTQAELHVLTERPEWRSLRAVREGRVYLTDGNQYFNRPGPRLVESAEILAEVLHPGQCRFGHEGTGWVRVGDESRSRGDERG